MKFRRPENMTAEQPTLYMDDAETTVPVESTPTPVQTTPVQRTFNRSTTGHPPVSQPSSVTPAPASYSPRRNFSQPTENKSVGTAPAPTGNMWLDTNQILDKYIIKPRNANKGSGVEFSKAAFFLGKKDSLGRYKSLEGKMLMNFWTFDVNTNHQIDLIPTYMDLSEWLNVCHLLESDERLNALTQEAREKQRQTGSRYCPWIYQNNGGSHKQIYKLNGQPFGGDGPKAVLFKITPGMRDNTWVLSSELYEGQTSNTGLIEIKQGSAPLLRIQHPFSRGELVSIAKATEIAIIGRTVAMACGLTQ